MRERNSSIEFLKVIAIIFIVLSHSMPDGNVMREEAAINLTRATTDAQYFIAGLIHNLGQIGNIVFIICSSWFILDARSVKVKKVLYMIADCFVISVFCLSIFLVFGYRLPLKIMIKQFFPVTFGNCWFLTCYLIFYMISPFLCIVVKNIKKRTLLWIDIGYIWMYCIVSFLFKGNLFYCNLLIGFIGTFFLVAYVKLYLQHTLSTLKKNIIFMVFGVTMWIGSQMLTNALGLRISALSHFSQRWNTIFNPCFLIIGFAMFNISRKFEFHNKFVNFVSSLSLLIYMIHTNRLVRDYFRYDLFSFIKGKYTYEHLLVLILLFAVLNLMVSFIIAALYQTTVKKLVVRFCDLIEKFLLKKYISLSDYLMQLK